MRVSAQVDVLDDLLLFIALHTFFVIFLMDKEKVRVDNSEVNVVEVGASIPRPRMSKLLLKLFIEVETILKVSELEFDFCVYGVS